jgi:hypothetical protein
LLAPAALLLLLLLISAPAPAPAGSRLAIRRIVRLTTP